jgi:hypothetical protein
MPRKKLIRHFEPRYGVSREMIEAEAKYVAREFDDHLLLSTRDLKEKRAAVRQACAEADQALEAAVYALPERERLALECMVVRDVYHLYALYLVHVRPNTADTPPPVPVQKSVAVLADSPDTPREKVLPFSEWLFDLQV